MMSIAAGTVAVTASTLPSRRTAPSLRLLNASSCRRCPYRSHNGYREPNPQSRPSQRSSTLSALALRLLRQARSNATTGSPPRFSCSLSVTYRPCRGSSGRPFGAMLFLFPPSTRVGPLRPLPLVVAVVPPLPPSPSLRYPAFRFRSLCSLHLHSGRSRSSPPESRRGSLDAPRRVSPSLTLRASRPPSKSSSSFLFLVCFYCFWCVILCLIVPCGSWLRFRIR
jgi:hypothetical protein